MSLTDLTKLWSAEMLLLLLAICFVSWILAVVVTHGVITTKLYVVRRFMQNHWKSGTTQEKHTKEDKGGS